MNEHHTKMILRQISDVLLINGGFLDNPGLYVGEMGLVLFFAHYARYTQNELYLGYCFDLFEKIQNKVHQDTPINYENGLAGIGAVIEYLVQYDFFDTDTDEILEDFDKQILLTCNIHCLSIDRIMDIGYYALWRLSGNSSKKDMMRHTILPQIVDVMLEWNEKHDLRYPTVSFFKDMVSSENTGSFIKTGWLQLCRKSIPDDFRKKTSGYCMEHSSKNDFWNRKLGVQNGLAGWGLSLLTELDGDDTWISLFPNDFNTVKNESIPV